MAPMQPTEQLHTTGECVSSLVLAAAAAPTPVWMKQEECCVGLEKVCLSYGWLYVDFRCMWNGVEYVCKCTAVCVTVLGRTMHSYATQCAQEQQNQ